MTNRLPESARRHLQSKVAGQHPDPGLLTAFAEQALTPGERDRVLQHLSLCAACREVVALAVPKELPTEVPTAVAQPWFRRPILHWAALAATAVIVWAAVSVLVPHTTKRDVSAPVESVQNSAPAASLDSKLQPKSPSTEPTESHGPAADQSIAVAKKTAPTRESAPTTNELASRSASDDRDKLQENAKDLAAQPKPETRVRSDEVQVAGAPANRPGPTALHGSMVANKIAVPAPAPPPPLPAPLIGAEKQSEAVQASGSAGGVFAGTPGKAKAPVANGIMATTVGTVGGPIVGAAGAVNGSSGIMTALLAGTITDPSGAVVPNALVKITNAKTKSSTAVRTDSTGTYRAPVAPGVYSVEATSPGFQPTRTSDIAIDGTVAQNLVLSPGAAAETVEVTGTNAEVTPPAAPAPAPVEQKAVGRNALSDAGDRATDALATQNEYNALLANRWRITPDGALEQSEDGKSWTKIGTAPSAIFLSVAGSGTAVWAGGENGALFHSSDAGRTWKRVLIGGQDSPVREAITAITVSKGKSIVVTLSSGERWLTGDAGATWRRLHSHH